MSRGGIDGDQQASVGDERRQGEKIDAAGKIDRADGKMGADFGHVLAFKRTVPAGKDELKAELFFCKSHDCRPTVGFPEFFGSRRSRMENGEWCLVDFLRNDGGSSFASALWKFKFGLSRCVGDSKRLEQGEIVIDDVHVFHRT